ncbi:pentatricopeptide repeat-containing protein [Quercus suber]|uniref:Pentatricopeptide repeat-containing protein n=1 Tax=Quercus suber TaxID=58331 RepID=A0AAW0M3E7_QUESU
MVNTLLLSALHVPSQKPQKILLLPPDIPLRRRPEIARRKAESKAEGARPRKPVGDGGEREVQLRRRNPNQQAEQPPAARKHRAVLGDVQEQDVAERLRARVQGVRAARRLAAVASSLQVHAAQIWCKPNEHIYTIMISLSAAKDCSTSAARCSMKCLAKAWLERYLVETFGKLGKLEKVSGLLKEMELGGNLPDIMSYNVLLEAYAKLGSIKDAMGVFRQMQAAGCVPNAATYSILLNLYGRNGRYDDVRELFLEMKVSNTEPDAATYNILIQVFGEGGYFKEVVTLFHDMEEENVEPNMETYEGGLHEDAKKILVKMNEKGIVPSSKAYTGVIEAYGQTALYEEALVAFNTMNEVGSGPTVETYNSLIHAFARGGLYKECGAILHRMGESGVARNVDSFNGVIEAFRQGGQFEEAVKTYIEMEKSRCDPDERTLEAVLSVYCVAGLVDESVEHFQEIKSSGILPSVMCYCMMLAVYAKSDRWDDAYELLDEMLTNRESSIHQVTGQLIKGDYDDDSNWQMVEYVFDKLNSEGCGLGMRFYNTLLEALWWLGQKQRAARVLSEALKRGIFPELFHKTNLCGLWMYTVRFQVRGNSNSRENKIHANHEITRMTLSPTLSLPHSSPLCSSPLFTFPARSPRRFFFFHRIFLSAGDRRSLAGKPRAKPKELVLGNPSVTVEKGKYSYDVETLINKLSSLPPRGSIARCLEMFKNKMSLNDFALVFKEFAQRGDWQRSLRLFKYMQRQIWCKPNEHIYTIMISLLGREGLLDKCREVFDEMPGQGVARTVFAYLVETFGKLGKLEKVSGLLKEMELGGNLPDIMSYNVLLEAYAKLGSIKDAMGVFRQMQAAGCVPNAATYSILLNLYGRNGRYDDMKVSNTEPDAATYNILIQVFGEGGYFKEVVTLFHDMEEENVEPNMETYEGGLHEDAKKILVKMNEKGIVPSSKAYTGVIEAYGQTALYEEALVAFNTMNEVGSGPTVETYNSLIHAFARGGLYKECGAILHRMGESGVARNVDSFNGVIEAFRQGGQFEEAVKTYIEMEKSRCDPDERTLEAVLSVYCVAGLVDESVEHFQEIKSSGILPSVMCYCMMLAVYAKSDSNELSLKKATWSFFSLWIKKKKEEKAGRRCDVGLVEVLLNNCLGFDSGLFIYFNMGFCSGGILVGSGQWWHGGHGEGAVVVTG